MRKGSKYCFRFDQGISESVNFCLFDGEEFDVIWSPLEVILTFDLAECSSSWQIETLHVLLKKFGILFSTTLSWIVRRSNVKYDCFRAIFATNSTSLFRLYIKLDRLTIPTSLSIFYSLILNNKFASALYLTVSIFISSIWK